MMSRRIFLTGAAAAGSVLGANERVNVAMIGIGGRGRDHINEYAAQPNARVTAVCDVNQAARERASAQVEKLQGHKPKEYTDMRQVFADKAIDAVSIATPNHWHALATIWACQAGKDVYCEKPACHNPWEGGQMIAAVRKYRRMVQIGSQSRSIAHKIEAMQLLKDGVIGKIYLAKGLCYKRRKSIGRTPDTEVPAGIDWSMFLGPAKMKPFSQNKYAYNWHWMWDTGNGDIGNQGVHEMDIARWGLGRTEWPKSVVSTGGKYLYDDDQETPNTQSTVFDYGDCELVFEVRGLVTQPEEEIHIGNLFYGSEGMLAIDLKGYRIYQGEDRKKVKEVAFREKKAWDTGPHVASFLKAVRSRKTSDLNAPVGLGVFTADLCHLANMSYRVGRKLALEAASGKPAGDSDAMRLWSRDYRAPYVVPEVV